jgi:hypothetical protein
MFHLSRKTLRHVLIGAVVVAAVAVASPVASSANGRTLLPVKCTPKPARWVVVDVNVAKPQFRLLPAIRCTDTVDNSAANCAPGSPYPGWVQVTDDLGIPWLVPTGSESNAASSCRSAAQTSPTPSVTPSPYPGWVFVGSDLGLARLVPLSDIR